jgi:hypothetical protein
MPRVIICYCITYKLVFLAGNIGNIHIMGGWTKFFELLACEDIDSDKMDLSVAVLAGLRGRHIDNLAWTILDNDETVLPQGRALHGVGGRSASIGGVEVMLMLSLVSVPVRLKMAIVL